jgi:hypothetical protein
MSHAITAIEVEQATPTTEQEEELLLVMGQRPVRDRAGRVVSSQRIPLRFDADELAEAASLSVPEGLERSLAWNRFADQLANAKLRRLL